MKKTIIRTIDFFYFKFLRVIPQETFRYGFIGGLNLGYGILQYWFIYNFILNQRDVSLGFVVISAPIFSFLINFVITFLTGFWLMREVAFADIEFRSNKKMLRYSIVVLINIGINYVGLKVFIEWLDIYPSISNAIIQPITIVVSYWLNKYFTFGKVSS